MLSNIIMKPLMNSFLYCIFLSATWVLLTIPQSAQAQSPNPKKRIYAKQSAATMHVKRFDLESLKSFPERGVDKEAIKQLVENKREEQNAKFDIEAFQEVTQIITQQYRQAGFVLVRAYIPEQDVNDGVVRIGMFYGNISSIEFDGNKSYSESVLSKPFDSVENQPAHTQNIETAMLHLNDYPGYTSTSIFVPGDQAGSSTMIVKTREEDTLDGSVSLDNYGSDLTGKNRIRLNLNFNNLSKRADQLNINAVQTINPTNSLYGSLSYTIPVFRPGYTIGLNYNNNSYAVGDIFEPLEIEGDSSTISAFGKGIWKRSKKLNLYSSIQLAQKNSSSESAAFTSDTETKISITTLSSGFNGEAPWLSAKHGGDIAFSSGTAESEITGLTQQDQSFSKINLNYQFAFPLNFVESLKSTHLILRSNIQQSSDELNALEQMPLGGPYTVRAYPISEFLVDKGFLFSIEWVAKADVVSEYKFLETLQVSAFIDYASGNLNVDNQNNVQTDITIKGLGFSAQTTPETGLKARFDLGIPIGEPFDDYVVSNDKSVQTFISLSYLF